MTQDALDKVSQFIGTHFVSFNIATHEKEFLEAVKSAIATGEIIRTQITPDNLKQVFDKWVEMVGKEIGGVADGVLLTKYIVHNFSFIILLIKSSADCLPASSISFS